VCGEWFEPEASQVARGYGKLCSERCRRHRGGLRAATERHQRADERLERMNEAGYVNLRQAADHAGVSDVTMHRYAALGLFNVGSRKLIEGEWWRLVYRHELERFADEDLLGLKRRAVDLLPTNLNPRWSGLSRQRWSRRRDARLPRGRRYSDLQADAAEAELRDGKSIRKTAAKTGLTRDQVAYLKAERLSD
jgi:hypothetical protein